MNNKKLDKLYMDIALRISLESKAHRKKVGCVIVKDNNIISFGYNGTPSGFNNKCEDRNNNSKPEVIHAEMNSFAKLAKTGVSCDKATMYLTLSPCYDCSKLIIQSGIKRLVFSEKYRNTEPLELLKKAKIQVVYIPIDKI
jgi:dCMP deaminase